MSWQYFRFWVRNHSFVIAMQVWWQPFCAFLYMYMHLRMQRIVFRVLISFVSTLLKHVLFSQKWD